jgi:hypothetical protein
MISTMISTGGFARISNTKMTKVVEASKMGPMERLGVEMLTNMMK